MPGSFSIFLGYSQLEDFQGQYSYKVYSYKKNFIAI